MSNRGELPSIPDYPPDLLTCFVTQPYTIALPSSGRLTSVRRRALMSDRKKPLSMSCDKMARMFRGKRESASSLKAESV